MFTRIKNLMALSKYAVASDNTDGTETRLVRNVAREKKPATIVDTDPYNAYNEFTNETPK